MNLFMQYLQVANSVFPCIFMMFLGFFSVKITKSDNYQHITSLAQNIAIPIRIICILAFNSFTINDLKIIGALILTQFTSAMLVIPFLFVLNVQFKLKTFAAILSIIQINNCITGIPFFSGVYSGLPKYSYMQVLVNFGICLPVINICFEYSLKNQKLIKIVGQQMLKTACHPQIIAIIIGILLNLIFNRFNIENLLFVEKLSDFCGDLVPPFGLMAIGMLAHQQHAKKQEEKSQLVQYSCKRPKSKILHIIILQLMRHLALPLVLIGLCKGFQINQQIIVEISVSIYAQPCQIISYSLCNKYRRHSDGALFDLIFGTLTVLLITPVLQYLCQILWRQ
ncbi:Membrane_transport family protein [Hexamita inflata]|uniref:Membrane transport family protein n=1 Tax=Hexamita inflata TaxID=28002 RepID=A0AA86U2J8_9EUKA|nr:Membrane transport family protein [Hexamita inflata]